MLALSTSEAAVDRARYHHGDLRNALLQAAGALLRTGGIEAVSLREAARAAGVSHNAPYRHFPSREALLAALAAEGFRALRARVENAGGMRLSALGRAYVAFAVEERALFLLMFGSGLDRAAFPEVAEAGRAALAVLDRAASGRESAEGTVSAGTLRAWALAHGLAHLVADGLLSADDAARALADAP